MGEKPSNLLLYVLVFILFITVAVGGLYFTKNKSLILKPKIETNETQVANSTLSPSTDESASTNTVDFDSEIKNMDNLADSSDPQDFDSSVLSDTELGL